MRNYIDANISRQITVDELASLIFKSRSQAIQVFKKEYGKTPYDYLLESRIKQSKILLKNTNLLIKEIAFKVGFARTNTIFLIYSKENAVPQLCSTAMKNKLLLLSH